MRERYLPLLADVSKLTLLSTSLPQISHPSFGVLQNNSTFGRSPSNSTIRFLTSSGFRLCISLSASTNWLTLWLLINLCALPLVASKHISLPFKVHLPIKQTCFPLFSFLFHIKPI